MVFSHMSHVVLWAGATKEESLLIQKLKLKFKKRMNVIGLLLTAAALVTHSHTHNDIVCCYIAFQK